jgi:hypothetical protein
MTPPTSDDDLLREMEHYTLRLRKRRVWLWMSLLPGPLAVPLWWDWVPVDKFFGFSQYGPPRVIRWDNAAFLVSNLALVLWLAWCSIRLMLTRREGTVLGGIGLSIALFLLFAAVNAVIFVGLYFASCTVMIKFSGP